MRPRLNVFLTYIVLACSLIFVSAAFSPASATEKEKKEEIERANGPSPPQMEVCLSLEGKGVEVSIERGYELVNEASGAALDVSGRVRLLPSSGGIRVQESSGTGEVFTGPLVLQPASGDPEEASFQLHNAEKGSRFRGALKVKKEGDELLAVNKVDLESYLRGVLPREMPSSWGNYGGMEALKAQAVAARTYALYNQSLKRHSVYHVCDTEHCQVYGGADGEADNTDRAVSQTRGEVLTYNNRVIAPFYHATNAGYTECPANVWGTSLPYLKSKPDPYDDPRNPLGLDSMIRHNHATWEAHLPVSAVGKYLEASGYRSPGSVHNIRIVSTFPSGRIDELRVEGSGRSSVSLFKEKARTVFGLRSQLYSIKDGTNVYVAGVSGDRIVKEHYTNLNGKSVLTGGSGRSTLEGKSFTALSRGGKRTEVPNKAFIIEGQGWGHGIGMSQNGAYNRSRDGQDYGRILDFYYPGTELSARGW